MENENDSSYVSDSEYSFCGDALLPTHFLFMSSNGEYIMKIDVKTGKIELNPDIDQDEAVKDFITLINSWIGIKG